MKKVKLKKNDLTFQEEPKTNNLSFPEEPKTY